MRSSGRFETSSEIPIAAAYGRALLAEFGASGEARQSLLRGTNLTDAALDEGVQQMPLRAILCIVENLVGLIGEDWPLKNARLSMSAMQGALDVAARSAPTVGAALDVLAEYGGARAPFLSARVDRRGKDRRLILSPSAEMSEAAWRSLAQASLLAVASMIAQLGDDFIEKARFEFPWRARAYAAQLRETVRCEVRYDAPAVAFCLPADICDRASPFDDAALHAAAVAELEEMARLVGGDERLLLALRRLIGKTLPERLTEERAAAALGVSRRSLVRRLAASGRSFRTVLDGELRQRAETLIKDGRRSRAEMAASLGYADPTSFSRACRRWFGGAGRAG